MMCNMQSCLMCTMDYPRSLSFGVNKLDLCELCATAVEKAIKNQFRPCDPNVE